MTINNMRNLYILRRDNCLNNFITCLYFLQVLVDRSFQEGKKYNLHDSWRSEWNGYYSNPSHGSNKYGGYHNHHNHQQHPDYDTNF